jgi:beta-glucosidase
VTVSVKVRNTGERGGDEVVQLYVRQVASSVKQPKQQLRGFRRIHLAQGEEKEVLIPLAVRDLAFYDAQRRTFVVEPGEFEIRVGASSEDVLLTGNLQVIDEREQHL